MHTTNARRILFIIFSMYVAITQCLYHTGQESKQHNLQSMFLTYLCLETGQGHKNGYASVDPKQIYSSAKFEKPGLNSVQETADITFLYNQAPHELSSAWYYLLLLTELKAQLTNVNHLHWIYVEHENSGVFTT